MFPGAMTPFRVEVRRGALVESVHRVSAAVVDPDGRLLAHAGDPDLQTYWRSAAKPFQALPLLLDGAAARFALTDTDLALTCASHSSEAMHLAGVDALLGRAGLDEDHLACGPHPPLSPEVAREALRAGVRLTPRWSNCSGKHAGLLALARHHGWPLDGYERAGHPVQERVLEVVARFTGLDRGSIVLSVDGCATVCHGLPLRAMALAYARFGTDPGPACRRLWAAATGHPLLVAGTDRFDTQVMAAWPGQLFAKVGAEGIYCVALPACRAGIALKVEDGADRAAPVAALAAIRAVLDRLDGPADGRRALGALASFIDPPLRNTRGQQVGSLHAAGDLRFSAP
jgi:L-asparaginase II